jgi:Tfp pilus assembly protein PilF
LHSGKLWEGLGLLQQRNGDDTQAERSFQRAADTYRQGSKRHAKTFPPSALRATLEEAQIDLNRGQHAQAVAILRNAELGLPDGPEKAALQNPRPVSRTVK